MDVIINIGDVIENVFLSYREHLKYTEFDDGIFWFIEETNYENLCFEYEMFDMLRPVIDSKNYFGIILDVEEKTKAITLRCFDTCDDAKAFANQYRVIQ